MNSNINKNDFTGCIYGLAIGDALGYPVEFISLQAIKELYGDDGLTDLEKVVDPIYGAKYSDDTQMSIATAKALISASKAPFTLDNLMKEIVKEYVNWLHDPENNRAPGNTCLSGCHSLESGIPWTETGNSWSKGCGAAMRTAPVGLAFWNDQHKLAEAAYGASICTHAHPDGVAAAIGTAYLTRLALLKEKPETYLTSLINFTEKIEKLFSINAAGFKKKILDIEKVIDVSPEKAIPFIGQGWVGDEAVAISLFCFLKSADDYKKTIFTAANITGDSDSTACIAGAISGAYNGVDAIPSKWIEILENSKMLGELAEELYDIAVGSQKIQ